MAEEEELEYDVTVSNGKYRLTYDKKMVPQAYRHGEAWPPFTDKMIGSTVILALVQEITALREQVHALEHLHDKTEVPKEGWDSVRGKPDWAPMGEDD